MDRIDLYKASNSIRADSASITLNSTIQRAISSSMFRSHGMEAFSRSTRDEDDEEALIWASLQKLPTYNRLKKGLLLESQGPGFSEVDIQSLGVQQRKILLERLVRVAEGDNENFLLKLRDRIDRVGMELPQIEVRFEHLHVDAEAYVGSRALPSFLNFNVNLLEGFLTYLRVLPNRKKRFSILRDVSGILKPCRMTLLLGPPSSGKTTLLKALAGKLDPDLKFSGNVTYNGHAMHEFVPQRSAAYISQNDCHIGEMTVRETLAFSAKCQGVGSRYEMLVELSRREKYANIKPDPDLDLFMKASAVEGQEASVVTDYILKLLGLEVCADTLVGNEVIRGISGGQRKRVTTGEMLVGPAKALFMDEISTGLDSSTTYQIVNLLRHSVHILQGTALISLLQPPPETYDLFDDIIVISDGHIVYQGPREHVLQFFESVGFKCPERKAVADFLQEVTSKQDQEQYWLHKDVPYRFITAQEFAEAYKGFHVGEKMVRGLGRPYNKRRSHPAALTTKKYGVSKMDLFKTCTSREILLMKRNSPLYIFRLSQMFIVGVITMTLFMRTQMHRNSVIDGGMYAGALFYGITVVFFESAAEISVTIAHLPVFYKQRDLLFFPSWSHGIPSWVTRIPIAFIEAAIWVFLTYYVIGFDPNAGRLFKQYLLLVLMNLAGTALFKFIGALGRNLVVANTIAACSLVVFFSLGGLVISRVDIKKWWIWAYWTSPMMYIMNAASVNEFLGAQWNKVLPDTTEPLGVTILKTRGFFPHAYWYWIGAGAMLGFMLVFGVCYILALTYLNSLDKPQAAIPEETYKGMTVEAIELSSQEGGSQIRKKASEVSSTGNEINVQSNDKKKGMVLPFEPHSITFDDIKYSVDMPQGMKEQGVVEERLMLLKGVSGAFRPGVLTALMGVSGAGKTTLMDVLAGRKTGGYTEGHITVSGYPKNQETFARISGYCEQNDIHSPHVTVYESLLYSAWLRLPPVVDYETRTMFVEEIMELVELKSLKDALVGLPGVNGLSMEQRKRLTIAVELVANPSIIFMDEPTSGLDARAAAVVMRTVRNIVDTGRTIVCTIHQPSIDIFEAFDELLLMKEGGRELYVGPLGRDSCQLIKYFEEIEGVPKIRNGYNPATWMLEVTTPQQEIILGVDFAEVYRNSDLYRTLKTHIKELSKPRPGSKNLSFPSHYSQSFLGQFVACLWKQRMSYWRNTPYTAVRFLFTVFIAFIYGTMFWDLGHRRQTRQDLFNAMGSMYSAVLFLGTQNASTVQPVVSIERPVFYRERAALMYSPLPYAFAQVMVELPYILAQAVVYGVIVYSMIGFEWTAAKFFWYLFFMYVTLLYFTFYGMMTVAATPGDGIATVLAAAFYGIWNLFSGFLVPRTRMPIWWRWYYWLCPVAWTIYGLLISQFGDIKDVLQDTNVSVDEFVESYFGYRRDFLGVVAAVVSGFAFVFAFIYSLSVYSFNFQKR